MPVTIAARIKALPQMSVRELQEEYYRVYREETSTTHKGFLLKKIAWKIQELEFGGIKEEVRQKALKMVEDLNLPGRVPSIQLKEKRAVSVRTSIQDKRLPLPGTLSLPGNIKTNKLPYKS